MKSVVRRLGTGLTGQTKRGQTKTSGGTQNSMVGTIGMWSPCRRQNANAWETTDWDETGWNETNWHETQTKQQTDGTGKVVGSLILSPVLHVDGCCSETCQTGLFLGDSDCEMDVFESFGTCVFDHETVFETNNSFSMKPTTVFGTT